MELWVLDGRIDAEAKTKFDFNHLNLNLVTESIQILKICWALTNTFIQISKRIQFRIQLTVWNFQRVIWDNKVSILWLVDRES